MAKFTGFMCDVCSTAENGHERPLHWLGVRMPTSDANETAEVKDICSDKCLVRFARVRAETVTKERRDSGKISGLSEFLDSRGIKPAQKGAHSAAHARGRHEMNGGREDCLVCEFLTMKGDG